jgi:ferredoxin
VPRRDFAPGEAAVPDPSATSPPSAGAWRSGAFQRGAPFTFLCDGAPVPAHPGETVATALLAAGRSVLRRSERAQEARGLFCGMGSCFECRVTVDGRPNQRACMTPARPGLDVRTGGLRP